MTDFEEVESGYKCPIVGCGHISPTVWDAFGHLNDEHPAGGKNHECKK